MIKNPAILLTSIFFFFVNNPLAYQCVEEGIAIQDSHLALKAINGMYYVASTTGHILSTMDAKDWNAYLVKEDEYLTDVAAIKNTYIAVSGDGRIFRSIDLKHWEIEFSSDSDNFAFLSIQSNENGFMALGRSINSGNYEYKLVYGPPSGESWKIGDYSLSDVFVVKLLGSIKQDFIINKGINRKVFGLFSVGKGNALNEIYSYEGAKGIALLSVGGVDLVIGQAGNVFALNDLSGRISDKPSSGDLIANNSLNDATFFRSKLIAVGQCGSIYVSEHMNAWKPVNSGTEINLSAIETNGHTVMASGWSKDVKDKEEAQLSGEAGLRILLFSDDGILWKNISSRIESLIGPSAAQKGYRERRKNQ